MIAATAMLAGCKAEEPSGLAVEYIEQTVPHGGGEVSFTVHPGSMNDWSISLQDVYSQRPEVDWIELSATSGSGETLVTATVKPNLDRYAKEALAIVRAADRDIHVRISQDAVPTWFRVTPPELTGVPADEQGQFMERGLTVEANIEWYAVIDVSDREWVSFRPADTQEYGSASDPKSGDDQITLRINNYYQVGGNPRTAAVIFYAPDGTVLQTVPVSQDPIVEVFTVTPDDLTGLPASEPGQNLLRRTLTVTTNVSGWYAEIVPSEGNQIDSWVMFFDDPDWSPFLGSASQPKYGNMDIMLDIRNNQQGNPARTATLTFYLASDNSVLKTVQIGQAAGQ
jgi:hypothetical protein